MLLVLSLSFGTVFAQQSVSCTERAKKWQTLLRDYEFNEMDAWITDSLKVCPMDSYPEIHHQAALTYLWRGKPDQAKPIIEKLTAKARQNIQVSPSATSYGVTNYLPLILTVYTGATPKVEEYLGNYSEAIVKFQEQALIYMLRNNDKRFADHYAARKKVKTEYMPILCRVYCKRNSLVKECPCSADPAPKPKNGSYVFYQEYLDGKPLDQIIKEVETTYADAPLLKKEIMECLGLK
jgi:hypothetical protein